MIKKSLFYIVLVVTAIVLVLVSFNAEDRNYAIIAEVEPQKTAISYHKPVRIKAVHVQPGEHVKQGDLLLEVERPDLDLDLQKAQNELEQLDASKKKRQEDYYALIEVETAKHRQEIASLDSEITELETAFKADSVFYAEVSNWSGTDSLLDNNVHYTRLNNLNAARSLELTRFASEKNRQAVLFKMDMDAFELQHARLTSEITSLLTEKEMLVQTAPIDGTIGNVSVQLMELVPPYQTIISVYDENPSIIRAYMNEQAVIPVQVGDKVSVESSNRTYAIEGEIIEIGSRIVSYPKQMISGEQVEMWGKELFVKIPDENNFLNGEKVYVLIDAQ